MFGILCEKVQLSEFLIRLPSFRGWRITLKQSFRFSCWLRRCFVSGSLRSCVCVCVCVRACVRVFWRSFISLLQQHRGEFRLTPWFLFVWAICELTGLLGTDWRRWKWGLTSYLLRIDIESGKLQQWQRTLYSGDSYVLCLKHEFARLIVDVERGCGNVHLLWTPSTIQCLNDLYVGTLISVSEYTALFRTMWLVHPDWSRDVLLWATFTSANGGFSARLVRFGHRNGFNWMICCRMKYLHLNLMQDMDIWVQSPKFVLGIGCRHHCLWWRGTILWSMEP